MTDEEKLFEKLSRSDIYEARKIFEERVWDCIGANGIEKSVDVMKDINDAISPYNSKAIKNADGELVIIDQNGNHTTLVKGHDGYEMEEVKRKMDNFDPENRKAVHEQAVRADKKVRNVNPSTRRGRRLIGRETAKLNTKLKKIFKRIDEAAADLVRPNS